MKDDLHFWARVEGGDVETCWLWRGSTNNHGYGALQRNKTVVSAHRWAYRLLRGEIPRDLVIDHLCQTPLCVNPWHMDLVTAAENSRRINTRKIACPQRHTYDAENTYIDRRGYRACKKCRRANTIAWKNARRGGPPRPYGAAIIACPQGHAYDEANTGRKSNGGRRCRACAREYATAKRRAS